MSSLLDKPHICLAARVDQLRLPRRLTGACVSPA
ncbi:hypothetical protein FHX52_1634 [Humibacillus xanthopallidus]|uniref:Uncharacterized protein n=1 Tax=Humibacillus xanthopallidus TaxID=412689 RepID=A0A543PWN4_9MICO|nr:hypothetical protein FHX52_1634 [Humibacillus xanthopallidus]